MPNQFWNYFGAFVLTLMIIYETKNYLATLIAGFIVFCLFYFTYAPENEDLEFTISSCLTAIRNAAFIFIIPYLVGCTVYTATKKRSKKPAPASRFSEKEKVV